MIQGIPAIDGLKDTSQARLVLLQSGTFVHAPVAKSGLQLFSDVLTALAGLSPTANKFPYFTGSGSAALATLTPAARAMLASATPVIANLGYTPLDAAGGTMSGSLSVQYDKSTIFLRNTDGSYGGLLYNYLPGRLFLGVYDGTGGTDYKRLDLRYDGTLVWDSNYVWHDGSAASRAVGTIGSNGAIMESGSNSNGMYWRFANGLQMCSLRNWTGGSTNPKTWTYPAAFYSQGDTSVFAISTSTAAPRLAAAYGNSTTDALISAWDMDSGADVNAGINSFAIGPWK